MNKLLKLREWIAQSRWRLYLFFLLLAALPIVLFSFTARRVLRAAWLRRVIKVVAEHLEQAHSLQPDFRSINLVDLDGVIRATHPVNPT